MDKSEIFLRLVSVSKSFRARTVVDGVDFDVRRGEIFCVLGPSGCGKTTLVRLIAGLEIPERAVSSKLGLQRKSVITLPMTLSTSS